MRLLGFIAIFLTFNPSMRSLKRFNFCDIVFPVVYTSITQPLPPNFSIYVTVRQISSNIIINWFNIYPNYIPAENVQSNLTC